MSLAKKLHPSCFTAMSGKMAAIVAHIISQHWTDPAIAEICGFRQSQVLRNPRCCRSGVVAAETPQN